MRDLLICIAHHHAPDRLQYVLRMLEAFTEYELTYEVIIDTNICDLDVRGENITVVAHPTLQHPFHLTWQHRKHIRARIDRYRWFAYFEDDLLLPFENFLHYMDNFALLWPKYIPSFLRVETLDGAEFALDVTQRQALKPIAIQETFCSLDQPYHGFWIMPQWALKESMTPEFDRVSESREVAASYPMWELNKTPLVELDGNQIGRKCFVYHLPNNYASCATSPHGKIKVNEIFL